MALMQKPAGEKGSIIETVVAERQKSRVEAIERQISTLQERVSDARLADADTERLAMAVVHAEKEFESWQVGGKKDLVKLSKVEGTLHGVEVELERITSFIRKKPDEIEALQESILELDLTDKKVKKWVEKTHVRLSRLRTAAAEMEGVGFSEKRAREIEKEVAEIKAKMDEYRR